MNSGVDGHIKVEYLLIEFDESHLHQSSNSPERLKLYHAAVTAKNLGSAYNWPDADLPYN